MDAHLRISAVAGRVRDRERMRARDDADSGAVGGAPTGGGRARPARREDLEQLPAAQVCITQRYVKASAQGEGAEGQCA